MGSKENDVKISANFSFLSKEDKSKLDYKLDDYKNALKNYSGNFDAALKLSEDMPIFLDTNVLLEIYKTSLCTRKQLKEFFNKNKGRIYVCGQVQEEFIKNRENPIDEFSKKATTGLSTQFGNLHDSIGNQIDKFRNDNKEFLKDHALSRDTLFGIKETFEKLSKQLLGDIEKVKASIKDLKYNDEYFDIVTQFQMLDKLTDDELVLVRSDFDTLTKSGSCQFFPGKGDKDKSDNSYGDFIIYHEMLKFVKQTSRNAIFLTLDVKKSDWLKPDRTPYIHYIENVYLNTGKAIYILNANDVFKPILNISFESVNKESVFFDDDAGIFVGRFWSLWEKLHKQIYKLCDLHAYYYHELYSHELPAFDMARTVQALFELDLIDIKFKSEFDSLRMIRNVIMHEGCSHDLLEDTNSVLYKLQSMINLVEEIIASQVAANRGTNLP